MPDLGRFNADPNFPRTHFAGEVPTQEEYADAAKRHEEAVATDKQLKEKTESGNVVERIVSKTRQFSKDFLTLENGEVTGVALERFKNMAEDEARALEEQYDYFQNRAKQALADLHQFEVEKLGMKPKDRRIVEG